MKAADLRVGNLVLHNKQIFEIHDIISTQDSVIIGQGDDTGGLQEVFISEIEPIQLTEEIILKCGFDIEWLLSDREGYYVLINNKKIRIKFVHSLQNTYLYIEQKELNLCL